MQDSFMLWYKAKLVCRQRLVTATLEPESECAPIYSLKKRYGSEIDFVSRQTLLL